MKESETSTQKRLRKIIFLLLSFAYGLFLALGVVTLVSWRTLNDARFVKQVTQDALLVFEVRRAMIGFILGTSQLAQEQTSRVPIEYILSDQQTSELLETSFSSFLTWLSDPSLEQPDIALNLKPFIDYIESPAGKLALLPMVQALPPCRENQPMIDPAQNMVVCVQSGKDVKELVDTQANLIRMLIPEQLTFQDMLAKKMISDQLWQSLVTMRTIFQRIRTGVILLWGMCAFFWVVLLVVNPVPWLKRMIDLRISFSIAAAICTVVGIGVYFLPFYVRQTFADLVQLEMFFSVLRPYLLAWTGQWIGVVAAIWAVVLSLSVLEIFWARSQSQTLASRTVSQPSKPRIRKEFR